MPKRQVFSSNNFTYPFCRTCFLFSQIVITRLVCTFSVLLQLFNRRGGKKKMKEKKKLTIFKLQVSSPRLCFCHACFISLSLAKCKTLFTHQGKFLQEHPTRSFYRNMLPTCYRLHSKTCRSKSSIVFHGKGIVLIQI